MVCIILFIIIIEMIEKTTYYKKYKKYKKKYLNKKKIITKKDILVPSHFYIVHETLSYNSLINILKEGIIKPGKDLPKEYRKLGGDLDLDEIFTNIYFPSIKNLDCLPEFAIILHPKILLDYDGYFNELWHGGTDITSLKLDKTDEMKTLTVKIDKIKDFLKHPELLSNNLHTLPGSMKHEFIFKEPILIEKYLIGVECNFCDEKQINKIKKLVNEDVQVLGINYPLPEFN